MVQLRNTQAQAIDREGTRDGIIRRTSVVNENVDATGPGLDLLSRVLDRLVAREVKGEQLDRVGGLGNLRADPLQPGLAFFHRAAAQVDVVRLVGLEQCLHGFVPDAVVGTSDDHDLWWSHCVGVMKDESGVNWCMSDR